MFQSLNRGHSYGTGKIQNKNGLQRGGWGKWRLAAENQWTPRLDQTHQRRNWPSVSVFVWRWPWRLHACRSINTTFIHFWPLSFPLSFHIFSYIYYRTFYHIYFIGIGIPPPPKPPVLVNHPRQLKKWYDEPPPSTNNWECLPLPDHPSRRRAIGSKPRRRRKIPKVWNIGVSWKPTS